MGRDLNHIDMIGRLTRDAEIKYTKANLCIANFAIAVNDMKKENNSWVDEVSFFDCTLFGKTAENIGKYLLRGKQVGIEGKLRQERWTNSEGEKRNRVKINVQTVQLLGGKGMSQADKTEELFKADDNSTEQLDDELAF
jgi:single-strand DNA-binding protein